jgi:hypothetical protein
LTLQLVFNKLLVALESLEVFFRSLSLGSGADGGQTGTAKLGLEVFPKFDDFNRVLISDSCNLSHALVLEKGMNLPEEVIEKKGSRL